MVALQDNLDAITLVTKVQTKTSCEDSIGLPYQLPFRVKSAEVTIFSQTIAHLHARKRPKRISKTPKENLHTFITRLITNNL